MLSQASSQENIQDIASPYNMFKYSVRSELTRKYYERRIRRFFDFIEFLLGSRIEERCNLFAEKGKSDTHWVTICIIRFLQHEKERVEKAEITAATLSNFVKSIKLYCEMCDISISWKKITRGLPRPRAVANDRAPTIEEIKLLVEYPDRRIKPIIGCWFKTRVARLIYKDMRHYVRRLITIVNYKAAYYSYTPLHSL